MTEGPALFEGRIDYIEHKLGEVQLVYIDLGQGAEPLTAKLGGNVALKRGAVIRLEADPRDLHIFDADGRSFLLRNRRQGRLRGTGPGRPLPGISRGLEKLMSTLADTGGAEGVDPGILTFL